jgi:hypothetical protein
MRRTGVDADGTWTGEEVRSPSMTRVFYWK